MRTYFESRHAILDYTPADHQVLVKTEDSASPDLSPTPSSFHQYPFSFHQQNTPFQALKSTDHLTSLSQQPAQAYRFGSNASHNFVPTWPNQHNNLTSYSAPDGYTRYELDSSSQPFQYLDDYDEADLVELPLPGRDSSSLSSLTDVSSSSGAEKAVRRRSSKACDQCRKSKCKCERGNDEACKSCIMLSVPCTFLGPSRKRGPPKGYIDAIEARLHQTEALLGILISSSDTRAQSLLRDLSQDSLAKEIISRVDLSPYGAKGRKRGNGGNSGSKTRFSHLTSSHDSDGDGGDTPERPKIDLTSTHPSNEWQDSVREMLHAIAGGQPHASDSTSALEQQTSNVHCDQEQNRRVDQPHGSVLRPNSINDHDDDSPRQRQRRRLENGNDFLYGGLDVACSQSAPASTAPQHPQFWTVPQMAQPGTLTIYK